MADVRMRFNLDKEEVELTVDGEVALASGDDVFKSWVDAYNDKHKSVAEPVEDKSVDVKEQDSDDEVVDTDEGE